MLPGVSTANLFFLLKESTGQLPLFLQTKKSPARGIEADIGTGDNATATLPPGPYFLGLPLLFFV